MGDEGRQQPQEDKATKPPRSKWRASKSFFDLKLSHWIEILLTAALVYVGTSQLLVYRRQAKIMGVQAHIAKDQLDEMHTQRRPWIFADISLVGDVESDQSGLRATLQFTLHNAGNLPAMYVWPEWRIYTESGRHPSVILSKQKEICAERVKRSNGSTTPGVAVFPNQAPVTISITTTMSQDEVNSDLAANSYMNEFAKSIGIAPAVFPVAVGCIDYQIPPPSAEEHHQTGFAYLIGGVTIGRNNYSGVPIVKEPLPADKVGFNRFIFGDTFFAN